MEVCAILQAGFGMELESIHLKKDGIGLTLSKDDWEEIQAVLNSERKSLQTPIKEGTYYPETIILHNYNYNEYRI
jgi:hypothetical protein